MNKNNHNSKTPITKLLSGDNILTKNSSKSLLPKIVLKIRVNKPKEETGNEEDLQRQDKRALLRKIQKQKKHMRSISESKAAVERELQKIK